MEETKYSVKEALTMLKGDYPLLALIQGKEVSFLYRQGKILVTDDVKGLLISEYDFLDLYKESLFYVDEESMDEETVDPKKDEEYYSWRQ